ncbi:DUF2079 domain-containing protein, partial [Patescibacteria group bacterium]|nr:DUF2079 domain-containing protein [Patescibacteria group bacterium]
MQSIEETKPKRQDWWRHHLPELLLAIAIIIFIGGIGFLASLRQANFLSSRFDLGLMDQVVWNTAHGRLLQLTDPDGVATISRLTIHADIFLALLAPLYWIYSSPYTLIALQTVILALGALPLYRLGCLVLKNRPLALTIAISYLAFPLMQRADLFDFHAVTLSTTFLLFAFYYAYTKQYWRFGLLSVLTMTTKETMPFLIIMLGIYILWTKRNRWVGLGTILISAAWFYVLLWWVMPGARGGSTHFALSYYSQFGATPIQIITTLVIKPWTWIRDLLTFKTYSYLHYFVLPTFLFSLFSPLIILLAI